MEIYVVKEADTVDKIAGRFGINVESVIYDNQLVYPYELAIGQALLIDNGETREDKGSGVFRGFAYPFISKYVLNETLPSLSELAVFSYGFTGEGNVIYPKLDDEFMIEAAKNYRALPILTLTPFDESGRFSNELISEVINNGQAVTNLINQLVDIMSEALPEELQDTLQNVQKASLKSKKKRSRAVVSAASAVAFGEGFIPIPFSDAAVLIPTQITMIASITTNFGMSISKSVIMSFISSTIGTAGTTILGKSMVSNLFKLIPGVGTGVGGMISGSTASLLTTALGEAYIKFMEMIYKGELKKEDLYDQNGQKAISKMFKEELTKKRKQSF